MNKLKVFTFVSNTQDFHEDGAFVARVAGKVSTPQQLFELLYRELALPGYFGFNWNALFDFLCDFHWISERCVVIVHEEIPDLPAPDMRVYLEVLRDAVTDWSPGDEHVLKVVFNSKDFDRIDAVMAEG